MYDEAAESLGKTFVTTELGGGGTATPRTAQIARKGVRNVLIHAGILQGEMEIAPTRHLAQSDARCFHFAMDGGMIDFAVTLGDTLREGEVLARIWDTGRTGRTPQIVRAQMDGLVTARHYPGLIQPGDCLAVLATEI